MTCKRCGVSYPSGTYSTHKTTTAHHEAVVSFLSGVHRYAKAMEMRAEGYTYQRIATELGVTRQRVHALLKKVDRTGRLPAPMKMLCFLCQDKYANWVEHVASEEHKDNEAVFVVKIGDKFR